MGILNKIKQIKDKLIFKVIMWIISVWFFGALLISFIEPGSFENIWNSLWWTIVTMTTVGYGDMAPTTISGRLLAIIIMLSGIILVALITGTISSIFTTKRIMEGKGLEKVSKENHIIICGWSPNIISLINKFTKTSKNSDIVLINDESQDKIDSVNLDFDYRIIIIMLSNKNNAQSSEELGAKFYDYIKKNEIEQITLVGTNFLSIHNKIFLNQFIHGAELKSYEFTLYKTKKQKKRNSF